MTTSAFADWTHPCHPCGSDGNYHSCSFWQIRLPVLRRLQTNGDADDIQERLPFLGLALVALFLAKLGNTLALMLTFALLVWQGLGGRLHRQLPGKV